MTGPRWTTSARPTRPRGGPPRDHQGEADSAAITDADVVLDNGLGLSPWFDALVGNVEGELMILTDDIAEEAVEESGELDSHKWMVPEYLAELDTELEVGMATIPEEQRKLVTSHDAYSYFAERYGLEVSGTVIGVTTDEEPSADAVAEVVDAVRAEGVPSIFVETTVNPDLINQVARDAGVEVGEPLYGDSVGEEGSGAEDYEGMMRANLDAIVAGLGGDDS